MPLLKGSTREVVAENVRELRKAGHKESQAVAIAMKHSRKGTAKPKSEKDH